MVTVYNPDLPADVCTQTSVTSILLCFLLKMHQHCYGYTTLVLVWQTELFGHKDMDACWLGLFSDRVADADSSGRKQASAPSV